MYVYRFAETITVDYFNITLCNISNAGAYINAVELKLHFQFTSLTEFAFTRPPLRASESNLLNIRSAIDGNTCSRNITTFCAGEISNQSCDIIYLTESIQRIE
jgi:hypothetical protein